MSLPIITLTSSPNANVNRMSPYNRSGRILRDPSFSSYLNGAEETFVLKLRSTSARHFDAIPQDRVLDAEIDVFNSEKYFSETYDSEEVDALMSRRLKKDAFAAKPPPPWIATASIGSESNGNSHRSLLQPKSLKKKSNFLASIGYGCSCRDKNSVSINHFDVQKSNGVVQTPPLDLRSDGGEMRVHANANAHFSFPVLDNDDDQKRMPFRAFASPILENGKYRFSDIPDESDSDASSDLFEIESFSMQASDGCITPQPEYAPSEASIEWSVVTASAADFSALSDTEEVRSNVTAVARSQLTTHQNQKAPKPRSSILSGCRNYKAVDVARSHRACDEKPRSCAKNSNRHCIVSKPHNGSAPRPLSLS